MHSLTQLRKYIQKSSFVEVLLFGDKILEIFGFKILQHGVNSKFRAFLIIFALVHIYPVAILHVYNHGNSTNDTIVLLSGFVISSDILINIVIFYKNKPDILEMFEMVSECSTKWRDLESPSSGFCTYVKMCKRVLFFVIGIYFGAFLFVVVVSVYCGVKNNFVFPAPYSIPNIPYDNAIMFRVNLMLHVLIGSPMIVIETGFVTFFTALVFYIVAFLEDLKLQFLKIGTSDDQIIENDRIKQLVKDHVKILRFTRKLSNLYEEFFLFNVGTSIMILCTAPFNLQIVNYHDNQSFGPFLITLCKLFLLCYCGDMITSKAEEMSTAIYCSQWYRLPPRLRRSVHFILMNSQRNIGLRVKWSQNLSLEMFKNVINTTYCIYTLLRSFISNT